MTNGSGKKKHLGVIERIKGHPLYSIGLIVVFIASATWGVSDHINVKPRDFIIQQQTNEISDLTNKLQRQDSIIKDQDSVIEKQQIDIEDLKNRIRNITATPTPTSTVPPAPVLTATPTPTSTVPPAPCYSDNEPDITNHGIKLINISATCEPNPPRVNSRITIEFTLQNVGNEPITFEFTFIAARNPYDENRDIGYSENAGRTIQPQEIIRTKGSIIVDSKGIWKFGPAYSLKLPNGTTEGNPNGWRRFPISVE